MRTTFDVLDELFSLLIKEQELARLLNITDTTDIAQWDTKVRRTFADTTQIATEHLNFFDFSFIPSNSFMYNPLMNKELLEFNIYVSSIAQANAIYKAIRQVIKRNFRELQCTSPTQAGCPASGVLRYTFRAKQIVGA